jgi:hypothetical protein
VASGGNIYDCGGSDKQRVGAVSSDAGSDIEVGEFEEAEGCGFMDFVSDRGGGGPGVFLRKAFVAEFDADPAGDEFCPVDGRS